MGKDILQLIVEYRQEKENLQKEKLNTIYEEWQKVLTFYSTFKESNKLIGTWIIKDYKIILKALKKDNAEYTLKCKNDLKELYE